MKTARSVCLDMGDLLAVEKVMQTYRKNFSQSVGLIITQWLRFQKERNEMLEQIEKQNIEKEISDVKQAKVLKDEK